MNYFAHGIRFLDRPWFVAGTALPDWLSVVDRRVRLRPKGVAPFADGSRSPEAELAAASSSTSKTTIGSTKRGRSRSRRAVSRDLFRDFMGPGDGFRCGFLGHITSELLLDAILIERDPDRLDAYYAVLEQLDGRRLADGRHHHGGQMGRFGALASKVLPVAVFAGLRRSVAARVSLESSLAADQTGSASRGHRRTAGDGSGHRRRIRRRHASAVTLRRSPRTTASFGTTC